MGVLFAQDTEASKDSASDSFSFGIPVRRAFPLSVPLIRPGHLSLTFHFPPFSRLE